MELRISIFQRKIGRALHWTTVGLGRHDRALRGANGSKLQQRLFEGLRKDLAKAWPGELEPLEHVRGRKLERVRLDFAIGSGGTRVRVSGHFPLVLEPRTRGLGNKAEPLTLAFHPLRPTEWFVHDPGRDLAEEAAIFFRDQWIGLDEDDIKELQSHPRDKLKLLVCSVTTRSLSEKLEKKKKDGAALIGATRRQGLGLLHELGTNLSVRALDGRLSPGMPRRPYRQQLQQLLCGEDKASTLLVGPPGVGRTMLLRRLVHDLLEADGYASHRNLDRVHAVWLLSGRRIIAGMSYLGQWEQRCVELLETCRKHRVVLWIDDVHAWGRIGEARESERTLSTFFRGPVARGEVTMVARCTAEEYQRLQDDAGAFASAFTALHVTPTGGDETMRMLVHEARAIELDRNVAFDPRCFRSLYELGGALGPGAAYPGRAVDLLRALGSSDLYASDALREVERAVRSKKKIQAIKHYRSSFPGTGLKEAKEAVEAYMKSGRWGTAAAQVRSSASSRGVSLAVGPTLGPPDVIELLSRRTGMPEVLLTPDRPLDAEDVRRRFAGEIMGQRAAVEAAVQLIVRVKSGLVDRGRPYGVFLFTGPTGTGKTEMAKCIAEYLYGDTQRLLRFDMSEYNGADAAARLIGDRWRPEGNLTGQVRRQPFCVVLLDEVEKASPAVLNLMLQLFDDGRLTDAGGSLVDFSHTVIIMTSNLGAQVGPSLGFGEDPDAPRGDTDAAVREFFPPELFNRIDHVVKFGALSKEAAQGIARRELSKLLDRRGLTERNIFVRFTPALVARAVALGFTAKDGARSLKRYLEEHVGGRLADDIAATPGGGVRVFWLYVRDDALRVHGDSLHEARVRADASRFEGLLGSGMERLREEIPAAVSRVDALLSGASVDRLNGALRAALSRYQEEGSDHDGDVVYNLESLRGDLRAIRERFGVQLEYDPRLAEGDPELEADRVAVDVEDLDRRYLAPELPIKSRHALLHSLFELFFLERAVREIDQPGRHEVLLELTRISRTKGASRFDSHTPGLLEWLAEAYAGARGDVDAAAVRLADESPVPRSARTVLELLGKQAVSQVCLRLVGPAVRSFFDGEHGTHVRRSLAGSTELVRVRVLPGTAGDPLGHLRALEDQRRAFAEALEAGERGALPTNPDEVVPIVRRYRYDARPGDALAPIEVEDYVLGHVSETRVRRLGDVLPDLWMLRLGAEIAEGER